MNLEFSPRIFGKKNSNIKFGAKLYLAEGRAGKTKLIVDFRKFAKVPKMISFLLSRNIIYIYICIYIEKRKGLHVSAKLIMHHQA